MRRRILQTLLGCWLVLLLGFHTPSDGAAVDNAKFSGAIEASSLAQALAVLSEATGVSLRCRLGGDRPVAAGTFVDEDLVKVIDRLLAGRNHALLRETDEAGRISIAVWLLEDGSSFRDGGGEGPSPEVRTQLGAGFEREARGAPPGAASSAAAVPGGTEEEEPGAGEPAAARHEQAPNTTRPQARFASGR